MRGFSVFGGIHRPPTEGFAGFFYGHMSGDCGGIHLVLKCEFSEILRLLRDF